MKAKIFFTLVAILVSTSSMASEGLTENVGGKAIKLVYPSGYVDLCSTDTDAAFSMALAVPAVNQLLGCYTTPKDYEEWKSAAGGVFSSHLISSVMKGTVNANVSEAEFTAFKGQAKANIDALHASMAPQIKDQLDKAAASISNKYGVRIEIASGQVVPLGIFDEGKNSFSSAWLASTEFNVNGSVVKSTKVQISSTVLSKGKAFVLFTYGEYKEYSDIERYKNVAKAWVSAFTKENL